MQYKQIDGTRQNLPKAWTLKDGSQTGNFDLLPESVHNDEGWYQCLDDPVIATPETHKLGADTLVEGRWQRVVVKKTVEEITNDILARRELMVVSPWQIRKALNITNGSRADVEAAISVSSQDTQDGWQYASSFERTNNLVLALGAALGMTDIELDELFELAATL